MTNKEIDKLLAMLDKKDLSDVKEYLLREKIKNSDRIRQSAFEKYLVTNIYGSSMNKTPRIYVDDNIQKFTNGISLYIINKNFFNTKTTKLIKGSARGTRYEHKFIYTSDIEFEKYIYIILSKYGNAFSECTDFYTLHDNNKYTYAEYYSLIDSKLHTEKFVTSEIDTANIILCNPNYTISHNFPILKAESDIGKCYILGLKNN